MIISVIILSWNRKDEILETLKNLKNQTYKDFEIIVVDQNSNDGTPEEITRLYPRVQLIKMHKNIGLSDGRNIGIANARGDILFFVDNDALLEPAGIEKTVKKFEDRPDVGIIGFKIINFFTKELDHYSWVYPKFYKKNYNKEFETYTYCGAGHAIRKEVFDTIGLYWGDLFIYWDENDLSLRALNKGFKILYYPEVTVEHRYSPEQRFWTPDKHYFMLRNSMWVNWRSFPLGPALSSTFVRLLAYIIKGIRNRCLTSVIRGLIAALPKIYLLFNNDQRMTPETYSRYKSLNDQGPFWWRTKTLLFGEQ